jgi:hypothetical protein
LALRLSVGLGSAAPVTVTRNALKPPPQMTEGRLADAGPGGPTDWLESNGSGAVGRGDVAQWLVCLCRCSDLRQS